MRHAPEGWIAVAMLVYHSRTRGNDGRYTIFNGGLKRWSSLYWFFYKAFLTLLRNPQYLPCLLSIYTARVTYIEAIVRLLVPQYNGTRILWAFQGFKRLCIADLSDTLCGCEAIGAPGLHSAGLLCGFSHSVTWFSYIEHMYHKKINLSSKKCANGK